MLKNSPSAAYVPSVKRGTRSPAFAKASVIETDCPPVCASSAIPSPRGVFARSSIFIASIVSSRLFVVMAPHWRIIPSHTACGAASEPVCDIVARAPASV
ncbi:MAG: hypothetical protein KatS3mg064_0168 [Tepidiforma sp.]|nr:MAG: hypothetical protein KatS3mg064_0168 [Tepidiforma sp.]